MIQRIQTLYLLFSGMISAFSVYLFRNSAIISKPVEGYKPNLIDMIFNSPNFYLATIIGLGLTILLSLITIFLFKKRPLQLKLGKLNILINVLLLGILVYHLPTLSGEISISKKGIEVFGSVFGSLLFLFLANRAIKKDENLVKSVDRLR